MRFLLMLVFLLAMCSSVLAQDGHRVDTFVNGAGDLFSIFRTNDPATYLWYDGDGPISAKIRGDVILFRTLGGTPFGGVVRRVNNDQISLEFYDEPAEVLPMDGSIFGYFYKKTFEDFWFR